MSHAASLTLPRRPARFKAHSVLPGFNLALGYTLLYLSLKVVSKIFFTVSPD
ncbi:MAG: hypothetical protein LBE50_04915 [Gallionellaceae bacterium]|jgi:hypothetical protein|nr:hypothetical protein [Gallionellaceae bacterium]